MPYATRADLEARFGIQELEQLTDRLLGMAVIDDVVARALADADAEIDARLATRYALPLAEVPAYLVRLACDLARYYLWADGASDAVRTRYEDALATLKLIAAGSVSVPTAAPLAPSSTGGATVVRAPASTFADPLARYGAGVAG